MLNIVAAAWGSVFNEPDTGWTSELVDNDDADGTLTGAGVIVGGVLVCASATTIPATVKATIKKVFIAGPFLNQIH